jgi:hypothetical protein
MGGEKRKKQQMERMASQGDELGDEFVPQIWRDHVLRKYSSPEISIMLRFCIQKVLTTIGLLQLGISLNRYQFVVFQPVSLCTFAMYNID